MAAPLPVSAQENQSAWQPTHPSNDPNGDHTVNNPETLGPTGKGFTRPAEGCTSQQLIVQQLVALCTATPGGYFWRWWDFNVYACEPAGTPTFRTVEYTRSTDVPCKKAMWEVTKKNGAEYGEDWTVDNSVYNSEKLEDPPTGSGDPPPPPGTRPDGRTAEASKVDKDGKVIEGKTASTEKKDETIKDAKTDTGTGGKTATGGGTGGSSKSDKHPKRTVRSAKTDTHAASQTQPQQQPMIGVGVGIGLGMGMGRRGDFGGRGDRN